MMVGKREKEKSENWGGGGISFGGRLGVTSGQRPSARACVPYPRRKGYVRRRFAHTQDFGGESLKSGDQDAIGRSGSSV